MDAVEELAGFGVRGVVLMFTSRLPCTLSAVGSQNASRGGDEAMALAVFTRQLDFVTARLAELNAQCP